MANFYLVLFFGHTCPAVKVALVSVFLRFPSADGKVTPVSGFLRFPFCRWLERQKHGYMCSFWSPLHTASGIGPGYVGFLMCHGGAYLGADEHMILLCSGGADLHIGLEFAFEALGSAT